MDYSAANTELWSPIIQFGLIALAVLFANLIRRKISFVRNSLMPTAVLAGFVLLILRSLGVIELSIPFLETITYHGIALGFIAMSLRVNNTKESRSTALLGLKSGALIVSTYLIQAIAGIAAMVILAFTFMPDLFKAAGILLPMGFGQGPGQANNVGGTYEALGFTNGRNFGLSIAAAGYLCACIVGVIMVNVLAKRGRKKSGDHEEISGSVTVDTFEDTNEVPISESIDRLSIQVALCLLVYFLTYLLTWGITSGIDAISPGLGESVNSLLWGFNFILGSLIAVLLKVFMNHLKRVKIMNRQYQNNYLLSRISGFAFDVMIIAGIASIEISDLSGLWVPFIVLVVLGGIATWLHLSRLCKKLYPDYYYEGLVSMYGMLTGTISSGVLLLRELDPEYKTPAANNLVLGSSYAIAFGIPMLILIGMAPKSDLMLYIVLGICVVYLALLLLIIFKIKSKKKN